LEYPTTLTVNSTDADDTRRWGRRLGQCIQAPLTIALHGDLGSGKTVFVQGLAEGLAVPDPQYVTSPTYTLVNEYPGRRPLYHVDLYRLGDSGDGFDIGLADILRGEGVVAIEWAERLAGELPTERLEVRLAFLDMESRRIVLQAFGNNAVRVIGLLAAHSGQNGSRRPAGADEFGKTGRNGG
jgi:tRNA threonylcarbamoyladenosine biosynthesis protein TsaE